MENPAASPRPGVRQLLRRASGVGLCISAGLHLLLFCALAAALPTVHGPASAPLITVDLLEPAGHAGGGASAGAAATRSHRSTGGAPPAAPQPTVRQVLARPAGVTASVPVTPTAVPAASGPERTVVLAAAAGGASGSAAGGPGSGGGSGATPGGGGAGGAAGGGAGHGAAAADSMPVAVRRVKPAYPAAARRQGLTGRVVLRVQVNAEGTVSDLRVESADPAGVFETQAVEAVRQWRFRPAVRQGAPVAVWFLLPIRFALE